MRGVRLAFLGFLLVPAVGLAQVFEYLQGGLPAPPDPEQAPFWLAPAPQGYGGSLPTLPQLGQAFLENIPVPPDPWDKVKGLRVGKDIRLVDGDFQKIKGQFVRVSGDSVTLRVKKNGHREEVTLPRNEVRMVSIRHSKAKPILLMILAGALMGASAMLDGRSSDDYCYCDWNDDRWHRPSGKEVAIGAAVGAATLGILGAFVESNDEVIYVSNPDWPPVTEPIDQEHATGAEDRFTSEEETSPGGAGVATAEVPNVMPSEAAKPEGGNVFVPLITEEKSDEHESEKGHLMEGLLRVVR